jgi:hypothetical protein
VKTASASGASETTNDAACGDAGGDEVVVAERDVQRHELTELPDAHGRGPQRAPVGRAPNAITQKTVRGASTTATPTAAAMRASTAARRRTSRRFMRVRPYLPG